jgi:hypothetical protein
MMHSLIRISLFAAIICIACENHNRVGKEGSTGNGGIIDSQSHYDTSHPTQDSVGDQHVNPNFRDTTYKPQKK